MSEAVFKVLHAGPHVSVQDGGRRGLMRFGVPASGAMDRNALEVANAALGNDPAAPAIEVSAGGLALECLEGRATFAVVGGGFDVALDEVHGGAWRIGTIRAGQRLAIRPGHWGSWTYLAFAGHLASTRWLNSAATHGRSGFGGGRLVPGGRVILEEARWREDLVGDIPCPVSARPRGEMRIVLGPQDRFFEPEAIRALLSQPFALTDSYDRMGVRLAGPPLRVNAALDMPSEPILRGSIQVSGEGIATVLLADHQTTGGYPKIATIIAEDLDGFVQLRARNTVTFRAISPAMAVEIARTRQRAHQRYMEAVMMAHALPGFHAREVLWRSDFKN
ncbi:MAG: biotin-dependent carboxyltransferase family protein [Proteobacteria bacterium]|nr:biotin-dependent carboxyltransferase family protein [Pseudomonadota bacterium]